MKLNSTALQEWNALLCRQTSQQRSWFEGLYPPSFPPPTGTCLCVTTRRRASRPGNWSRSTLTPSEHIWESPSTGTMSTVTITTIRYPARQQPDTCSPLPLQSGNHLNQSFWADEAQIMWNKLKSMGIVIQSQTLFILAEMFFTSFVDNKKKGCPQINA